MRLVKKSFREGIWIGEVEDYTEKVAPSFVVSSSDRMIDDMNVAQVNGSGTWQVSIRVPADVMSDAGEVFLIVDQQSGDNLASFAVYSDASLNGSLRTEVDLLRAELEMLKRAFRRHCAETENDA